MIPLRFPRAIRPLIKLLIYFCEIGLYAACDAVITVTEGVAARLAQAVRRDKITVIYNASGQKMFCARPCNFQGSKRRIVHLGNLTFRRGVQQICEAMRIVSEEA